MSVAATVLAASEVSKHYDGLVALDGVSIEVARGECHVLIGESGSGKTTLLRCFNRLTTPDRGTVTFEGADVARLDPVVLRRRIGYVPQEGGLLPHWRVGRNVELVPWLEGRDDRTIRANRALELVGLDPTAFATRWPRELSGGQRQRVAVARALAAGPDVVLMDEPFGAVDAITRVELQQTFDRMRDEVGVTCLLITHDLHEALALADRVTVLRNGRVEQCAPPNELRRTPATAYVRTLLRQARIADS